ncbi:ATP-binding protein [Brevundimonas sp. NIBR11]|uniref:sensor histidine kinase n=1 Tax=Brevundimonas sp. NIBR11 TaxID=3015999 RepID=UPI0022F14252|nr:ATP-binding protein [Brevundimonas sp. NIBR11]WGM31776.1 Adaptive-response sensory-kinase SasA [Brevundimonas sp. NIBR11]
MSAALTPTLSRFARFLREGTLGRSIFLLLAGAVVLLLLVNVSTFVLIQRTASFNQQVDQTWQLRRAARGVILNIKDAETAQRGYLLTGQSSFLLTYDQSRVAAPRMLERLEALAGSDEISLASVEALTRLSRDKFLEMSQIVSLSRSGQNGQALDQVRSGRGKLLMDQLDAEIATLDSQLGARLQAQTSRSEASAVFTIIVNAVAGALILVLAAIVLIMITRYLDDLAQARADLDRVNAGLEETVKARTAALTRANEEVQRFAYIVSHDLRSPLVNVMGYTAELEQVGKTIDKAIAEAEKVREVDKDVVTAVREDLPEAVGFIRASTEKMDRLINAILKLSREGRRGLIPETIDVGEMARAAADSIRHQLDETNTEFVIGEMATFESDRLSVEQIIGNLIENAVKYSEPGRPNRIEVSGHELAGGWVEIRVADRGRGIAPKDHERIFELFRRSGRQDRPGEGLGLAFVRNSVRRLGGSIDVDSELGEGSTFILKFPKRLILDEAGEI